MGAKLLDRHDSGFHAFLVCHLAPHASKKASKRWNAGHLFASIKANYIFSGVQPKGDYNPTWEKVTMPTDRRHLADEAL